MSEQAAQSGFDFVTAQADADMAAQTPGLLLWLADKALQKSEGMVDDGFANRAEFLVGFIGKEFVLCPVNNDDLMLIFKSGLT